MRVLIMSWEYAPHLVGGLGKHVQELAPALVAQGAEVHVLTPLLNGGLASEVTPDGIVVHRVAAPAMAEYGFITFNQEMNTLLERAWAGAWHHRQVRPDPQPRLADRPGRDCAQAGLAHTLDCNYPRHRARARAGAAGRRAGRTNRQHRVDTGLRCMAGNYMLAVHGAASQ